MAGLSARCRSRGRPPPQGVHLGQGLVLLERQWRERLLPLEVLSLEDGSTLKVRPPPSCQPGRLAACLPS